MAQNPWDKYEEVDEENPWDSYETVTDMDVIEPEPVTFPAAEQARFDDSPTLMDRWGSFRKPMTSFGRETAEKVNQAIPGMQSEHPHARFGRGVIDLLGAAADDITAPINAIPAALTMGAGALKSGALSLAGRLASIPTALSGSNRMKEAEGFGEFGLGALETIGGILGMRAPKPVPNPKHLPPKSSVDIFGEAVGQPKVTIPGTPKLPVPEETVISTSGKLIYSPTAEKEARRIIAEFGYELPPNASNKDIVDLAESMAPGYQSKITKPVAPVDPEMSPAKNQTARPKMQVSMNGEIIHPDWPDYVLDKDGNIKRTISGKPILPEPPEVARNRAIEVLNTPRAINASMDFSFPLRQGVTLMHKPAWWRAWGNMIKAGFSGDEVFKGMQKEILDKPNYQPNIRYKIQGGPHKGKPTSFADWAGLAITDTVNKRELEHMRSYAEKIPGYKTIVNQSNKAYTAYANKLRSDVFDSLVDDFTKAGMDPRKDHELAKNIAGFVNAASGRGEMKSLERYMEGLNTVFFSPRLQLSRMQMGGNTAVGAATLAKDILSNPRQFEMLRPDIRKEYLKSMLTLGGAWATAATMAKMAGAEVSTDPTNPDFAKIKIGNTRLDPGGGFQQFIVLAAKMAKQQSTSSTTGKTRNYADAKTPFDPTMKKDLANFGYNKMAPLPRAALDFMGRTQNDQFDPADLAVRLGSPIIAQDIMEIVMNEGMSPELLGVIPSAFGVGVQTYGEGGDRRTLGPDIGTDLMFPKKTKSRR